MKAKNIILLFILITFSSITFSQNTYDIKNPGEKYASKCKDCLIALSSKPQEVQMGLFMDSLYNIYFTVTDYTWFKEIFKKKTDGIAIDIITKDQFECGQKNTLKKNWAYQGKLLPPVYLPELKKNMAFGYGNYVIMKVGELPKQYYDKEVEFNLILLKKKNLCYYTAFFEIERFNWDLLEMGLYMDTIVNDVKVDTSSISNEQIDLKSKNMTFVIPFEKNKSVYSPEDIKSFTDSMLLTDYEIKKININAYASVEGQTDRNTELMNERAQSMIDAIQTYQIETIEQEVYTSENWVEFFNDIEGTSFQDFGKLTQAVIKNKLNNEGYSDEMETILSQHRKAVVNVELEKKSIFQDTSEAGIKLLFEKTLEENDIDKAVEIQNYIFSMIIENKLPSDFINRLEIPEKKEFSILFNNSTVFQKLYEKEDALFAYEKFKDLEEIFPDDAHIKYNICALKFDLWISGEEFIDHEDFLKEIKKLKKYGISEKLVNRMLINYHIILTEFYMMTGNYTEKDKSLKYIKTNYKKADLNDFDLLSLAQYFTNYAKYDWAIKLISPRITEIDIDEDLLFYYINLTLIDDDIIDKDSYRIVLENALRLNKERFCNMFKSNQQGGITFQLLKNEYLKLTHCENCNE